MWMRFTEQARRVVFCAQKEAERLGHQQLNTEHLLLGLFCEDKDAEIAMMAAKETVWPPAPTVGRGKNGVAVHILRDMGFDLDALKSQIKQQSLPANDMLNKNMKLSAASKRVIDMSYDEARQLKNKYIGTEHLLLGLLREGEGLAGRLLAEQGISLEQARLAVAQCQNGDARQAKTRSLKKPWWASLFGSKS